MSRLLPPANEVWGKVMLSQVFVCPQGGVCIQGGSASRVICTQGVCMGGLHPGGRQILPIGYYGIRSTSGWYAYYWNAFLFGQTSEKIPIHPVGTSINFTFCEEIRKFCMVFTMAVYEKIFGSINK